MAFHETAEKIYSLGCLQQSSGSTTLNSLSWPSWLTTSLNYQGQYIVVQENHPALSTLTVPLWDSWFQLWSHSLTVEATFLMVNGVEGRPPSVWVMLLTTPTSHNRLQLPSWEVWIIPNFKFNLLAVRQFQIKRGMQGSWNLQWESSTLPVGYASIMVQMVFIIYVFFMSEGRGANLLAAVAREHECPALVTLGHLGVYFLKKIWQL